MIARSLMLLSLAGLAACKAETPPPLTAGMSAQQAVMAAAEAAPKGVEGTFSLMVRNTAMVGPRLFLNSQMDYRDQRNLSIAIESSALPGLQEKLGGDPQSVLKARDIWVRGTARRVRIEFTENGKPTGKYYYQTHVTVTEPSQISLLGN